MLKFIEERLSVFKTCFSRAATYRWFVIIVIGLMTRTDFLGVTSIIRCLSLRPKLYESLIHFFRSSAYSKNKLRETWYRLVRQDNRLYKLNGRNLLAGDGTKESKEGRYMPGVKKLAQESENSAKPEFIFGHMFGGIGAVIHQAANFFCIPLDITLQDGLKETSSWKNGNAGNALSHVVQMIRNSYDVARTLGSSYLVMDRYFLSVPALEELDLLNRENQLVDIITRAKNSCTAYLMPNPNPAVRRGRPRKKGASVKMQNLFQTRASEFIKASAWMYGKKESVEYLLLDLLWGKKLYRKLRFVLVKSARGNAILVSSDLALDPVSIIEAYALRFKIETTFREFKQQIGGFRYHFWTKAMPKINRFRKKTEDPELKSVEDPYLQRRILKTIEATERFVLCASIAMGITQMMALTPSIAETARKHRYLRTSSEHKVSEATILEFLRKNIFRLLCLNRHLEISRLILSLQAPDNGEDLE